MAYISSVKWNRLTKRRVFSKSLLLVSNIIYSYSNKEIDRPKNGAGSELKRIPRICQNGKLAKLKKIVFCFLVNFAKL